MSERVEARNVSMYPQDWKLVDESSKELGLATSPTLRMIVRQWAANKFQVSVERGPVTECPADVDDAQA